MRFLLDEDLPPEIAETARGIGIDTASVHELGRLGLDDDEQLRLAAADGCVFVTRNRDDFIRLTVEFYQRSAPHPGVLIVTRALPNNRPEAVAHSLAIWAAAHADDSDEAMLYRVDFLS